MTLTRVCAYVDVTEYLTILFVVRGWVEIRVCALLLLHCRWGVMGDKRRDGYLTILLWYYVGSVLGHPIHTTHSEGYYVRVYARA